MGRLDLLLSKVAMTRWQYGADFREVIAVYCSVCKTELQD